MYSVLEVACSNMLGCLVTALSTHMNAERSFRLLFAKAAIERVSEWRWSQNYCLCYAQGHKKPTFLMKIVTESIAVAV